MFIETLSLSALLLALMLPLTACHKGLGEKPKPSTELTQTTLSVTPDRLLLRIGKHTQLSVSATPADAALRYTYKSTDETVATASDRGSVTAVAEGHCIITIAADEAHVTAPVQVLSTARIDVRRYIRADDTDRQFVLIYMPILTEVEQHKGGIQGVNGTKDWPLEGDRRVSRSPSYALSFIAPSQGDNYTGIHYIKRIAYRYTPGCTDRSFLLLFTAYLSNEDILTRTYQKGKDNEACNLFKSITQGYDSTEDFGMAKDDKKEPLFSAYCRGRYPEGDSRLCIRSAPAPDGAGFGLRLQITTSTVPKR